LILQRSLKLPYILESILHPFYSFRGLKNQLLIIIACGLDSRSWAVFLKNYRAAVRAVRTIRSNNLLFSLLFIILYNIRNLLFIRLAFITHEWINLHLGKWRLKESCGLEQRTNFFRLRNRQKLVWIRFENILYYKIKLSAKMLFTLCSLTGYWVGSIYMKPIFHFWIRKLLCINVFNIYFH